MQYTGEICPVCHEAFREDDDIVVCPTCGTPHHRKCYFEHKDCFYAKQHAEAFVWTPQQAPTASAQPVKAETENSHGHRIAFCPNCGAENPAEEPNCKKCGARLYNNPDGTRAPQIQLPDGSKQAFRAGSLVISPAEKLGENTVGDIAEYVRTRTDKYIPKFFTMENTKKKASFNWAAFFFGPLWFFYRRMYAIGAVIIVFLLAVFGFTTTPRMVKQVEDFSKVQVEIQNGVNISDETQQRYVDAVLNIGKLPEAQIFFALHLLTYLCCGIFGNYAYKKHCEKQVSKFRKASANEQQYRLLLFKQGGTSILMGMAAFLLLDSGMQILAVLLIR